MPYKYINEMISEIPSEVQKRFSEKALFIAYNCVLLERSTGKSYVYIAANLQTRKFEIIGRKTNPLTQSGYEKIIEKMSKLPIAGTGRFQVDMPPEQKRNFSDLSLIQNSIFTNILPEYGYGVREKQVELADHILETISHRTVSLSEAEVGIGKTHAYLIAAALAKRGRLNDFWLRGRFEQSYAASAHMPVVISTSSIALQKAIVKDYLPQISRMLMENRIIKTPLTCVIRKGKEHYICDKNLLTFYENASESVRATVKPLFALHDIDLGELPELTPYIKRKIGVSGRCSDKCPKSKSCRYLKHMKHAQSGEIDFQVCNHNYFLADLKRRSNGQQPLIPHYQAVIIDEGHKFVQAAQSMYGIELSNSELSTIVNDIYDFTTNKGESPLRMCGLAKSLSIQNENLFKLLCERIPQTDDDDDVERYKTVMDRKTTRCLHRIQNIIDELDTALNKNLLLPKYRGRCSQIRSELFVIREKTAKLRNHADMVYWLEKPVENDDTVLKAIPKRLYDMLYADLWSKNIPIVLTSGTLSAGGSFEHIKRHTGLYKLPNIMETSKPSPFDHRTNAMLYISENMPFPNNKDDEYIDAIVTEVENLIRAAHGHTAVLFTSYKVMGLVFSKIQKNGIPYPMFRLSKGDTAAIEQFKQCGNGVLFASGALWEGIDLPGDTLSMLIIVKLPFAVPDPISEYEQTQYPSLEDYKNAVVVPDMIIKLKQGFGRLLRSEADTGVVALLDSRVSTNGSYRKRVLTALPDCPVTDEIQNITEFIHRVKNTEYFEVSI